MDPTPVGHLDPLNAALRTAEAAIRSHTDNVAVLQGDLPALQARELAQALSAARAAPRSFVSDRHGTGTAALFAFGVPLDPDSATSLALFRRPDLKAEVVRGMVAEQEHRAILAERMPRIEAIASYGLISLLN